MKKIIKLKIAMAVIILFFTAQVHSQGFYVTAGAGYGLSPVGNSWGGYESNSTYTNTQTTTWDGSNNNYDYSSTNSGTDKKIKGAGSFGKGVQVGATFGYMFTENIGAELGFDYLIGTKITTGKDERSSTYINKYIDLTDASNNTTTTSHSSSSGESKGSGNMLRIIPALRISVGKGSIKPYAKLGLVIGVTNKVKETNENTNIDNSGVTTVDDQEYKYSGGVSIGFAGALGANFKLTDHVGIFAEIGIITQSWAPNKGVLTKDTKNGVDQLPSMTTNDKETEFLNSYSYSSADNTPGSPSKNIKIHFPFSSIGLNVGVSFSFGGK